MCVFVCGKLPHIKGILAVYFNLVRARQIGVL